MFHLVLFLFLIVSNVYAQNDENITTKSNLGFNVSDPLGQKARIQKSIPKEKHKIHITSYTRVDVIKKVQLTLLLEGLYNGPINGILDSDLNQSIKRFKNKYQISSKYLLDTEVLNLMGIKGD